MQEQPVDAYVELRVLPLPRVARQLTEIAQLDGVSVTDTVNRAITTYHFIEWSARADNELAVITEVPRRRRWWHLFRSPRRRIRLDVFSLLDTRDDEETS